MPDSHGESVLSEPKGRLSLPKPVCCCASASSATLRSAKTHRGSADTSAIHGASQAQGDKSAQRDKDLAPLFNLTPGDPSAIMLAYAPRPIKAYIEEGRVIHRVVEVSFFLACAEIIDCAIQFWVREKSSNGENDGS